MKPEPIPFLDLVTVHQELEDECVEVFRSALKTAGFIGGPMVQDFEQAFAQFCRVQHCVGVGSGTDALRFALLAAGVSEGDMVLTVPNTFIATTEAISQAGACPDFVDVDARTYTMDPALLRQYLHDKCTWDEQGKRAYQIRTGKPVTAVVPVHLYGQMADMDEIIAIAEQYHLKVIEDACQAHGAEYFSRKEGVWRIAGSMGCAAAFSFYPGKNLGACGEAGAITTDSLDIAQRCHMFRDHGQSKKYYHEVEGYNGRLDAIQAGVLRVKLRQLSRWNEQRREAAVLYDSLLGSLGEAIIRPEQPSWAKSVHHLYVIRVQRRDELQAHLSAAGIGTGIHYPIPLHLQAAYRNLGYQAGDYPIAEELATEILSLPMFPGLKATDQQRIGAQLASFFPIHVVQ